MTKKGIIVKTVLSAIILMLVFAIGERESGAREISAELPPGFRITTIVSDLERPTDIAFLPDNRMLITEHGTGVDEFATANVVLVENGQIRPEPVLTLSVIRHQDSGLFAITLDPEFETNGWFYLWYAAGKDALDWNGDWRVRLSRFTWDSSTATADPGSELILLESGTWEIWHHGNRLMFDRNGDLWIAVGDMSRTGSRSQDLSVLEGKILRIRPNATGYTIPADNPFLGRPNVRPEIYAYGLRNPYVMARRWLDGVIVVGDVGAENYEEINHIKPGVNYGWREREGICPKGQYPPCDPAPPHFTDPVIYWRHDLPPHTATGAITGLTFYHGTQFPSDYRWQLFYTDATRGFIHMGDPLTGETWPFATGLGGITRLREHDGLLYALSAYSGSLRAIYYEDGNNYAPSVTISADSTFGAAPHQVAFSADATDPDDTLLRYRWDFGDGSTLLESTTATAPTHTYSNDGQYTASVTVIDARGAESAPAEIEITVYGGELPTLRLDNLTNSGRQLYYAGDTIQYQVERSTLADLDSNTPFTWDILLHHATHTHAVISGNAVQADSFTIPRENHDGASELWYAFHVTMHTSSGLEITFSESIQPAFTRLIYKTSPPGGTLVVNGVTVTTPHQISSIIGLENEAIAPEAHFFSPDIYAVSDWVRGNRVLSTSNTLTTFAPAANVTYKARYLFDREGFQQHLPFISR